MLENAELIGRCDDFTEIYFTGRIEVKIPEELIVSKREISPGRYTLAVDTNAFHIAPVSGDYGTLVSTVEALKRTINELFEATTGRWPSENRYEGIPTDAGIAKVCFGCQMKEEGDDPSKE